MYVRLAVDWADPTGAVHNAGEFVDIDVVTLAELEEQGVVDNPEEIGQPQWVGPGKADEATEQWVGPGDDTGAPDDVDALDADADAPDADQEV